MSVIAVDWSGDRRAAQRPHKKLWLAEVDDRQALVRLEASSRRAVIDELVSRRHEPGLVVGLDVAFGYPAWFAAELGCANGPAVWAAADRIASVAADQRGPFWGWAGSRAPLVGKRWRVTESLARAGGLPVKSVFQLLGPGSVGTGTIAALPALATLADAGFVVWPFEAPPPDSCASTRPMVLEVYPRSFAVGVVKSRHAARADLLTQAWPNLDAPFRRLAEASDDAFDATVTALGLAARLPLHLTAPDELDPIAAVEGWIWLPPRLAARAGRGDHCKP